MATAAEVEHILADLAARLGRLDPAIRAALPARRTVELHCPDLERSYSAVLQDGRVVALHSGPDPQADVRIACHSDDLVALGRGQRSFASAYASGRIRLTASTTDLLRLRALL